MEPWLIQRGKFKGIKKKDIVGIDSLVRFDYMGSAEFEFGALPRSLRRMVGELDKYEMFKIDIVSTKDGLPMYIYCNKNSFDEVKECAIYLSKERFGYKEWCDMPDFIEGKTRSNNFWWDIENDYMVCFGKLWADKVEVAMSKLWDKWS